MIRFSLVSMILFIGVTTLTAQNNSLSQEGNRLEVRLYSDKGYDPSYEGSAYINEEFNLVEINDLPKTYKARYNVARDQFEVRLEGSRIIVLDNLKEKYRIKFLNSNIIYETVVYKDGGEGYAILLCNKDDVAVYKREIIEYTPAKEPLNGYQTSRPARFTRENDRFYYTKSGLDYLLEIPTNRRKFYNLFPKQNVKAFIKENDLNFKNQTDIVTIFKHFKVR